ncbi:hypothetical protein GF343_02525 [Candidatus Woesearchaeota archaeon]|nr:hypothetical protein [Candidatus Woesearchaeota archaeon]
MGEDYVTVHLLQNYDPGPNDVGSQMIGVKSAYIPGKALIKYSNGGITRVIIEPNTLEIVDKMIEQKTPDFYRSSLKIPKKLAKELLSAARKLDKRGKTLISCIKEAEEQKAKKK